MLLDKSKVYGMYRCPKSGAKLEKKNTKLTSDMKESYNIVDEYPILIDFNNTILNREDIITLSSIIERRTYKGGLSKVIKKLLSTPKNTTTKNIDYIISALEGTDSKVLIVGGGSIGQGIESLYTNSKVQLISFDIYGSPNVQFIADAHNIPLADNSFDAVIIQAVLEHVLEPDVVVSQIYRVLKTNGIVYAETPFLQHVHEGAYDFTRFTESGHRYLFKDFQLIQSGFYSGSGTQLLWSLDNYFRGLFRSRKVGKVIKLLFFWLQYTDRFIPDQYNIDAASSVFFMGRKETHKTIKLDMVKYYQGAQK